MLADEHGQQQPEPECRGEFHAFAQRQRVKRRGRLASRIAAATRARRKEGLVSRFGKRLPSDLVRSVLGLVPGRPGLAWSTGGSKTTVVRPGSRNMLRTVLSASVGEVLDIKFLPRRDLLVTVSMDGPVTVWDVASGSTVSTVTHGAGLHILDMQVFPDGNRLVTTGVDKVIAIWSAASGEALERLTLPTRRAHAAVRVSPAGDDRFASGSSFEVGDPAIIWSGGKAPRALHRLWQPGRGAIRLIEISPCGRKLLTTDTEQLYLWSVASGRLEREIGRPWAWASGMAVSPRGTRVASSIEGRIAIWSGRTGVLLTQLHSEERMDSFAFLDDGRRMVTFAPSEAAIWSVDRGAKLLSLEVDEGFLGWGAERVVVSEDGLFVSACGARQSDRTDEESYFAVAWAAVWDAATGRRLQSSEEHVIGDDAWLCSIAISNVSTLADEFDVL